MKAARRRRSGRRRARRPRAKVHTPGHGDHRGRHRSSSASRPKQMLKSLLYVAGGDDVVMAVVRGDHDVNEVRLARALGSTRCSSRARRTSRRRPARRSASPGPSASRAASSSTAPRRSSRSGVTGANETDYHLKNVGSAATITGEVADVRLATTGDPCPNCEGGKLTQLQGDRGRPHLHPRHASTRRRWAPATSTRSSSSKPLVMGCYGIGVSRLVATTIEQHHDDNGIRWPMSVAPYHVHLVHARARGRGARRGRRRSTTRSGTRASRCSGTTATSARA